MIVYLSFKISKIYNLNLFLGGFLRSCMYLMAADGLSFFVLVILVQEQVSKVNYL